MPSNIVKLPPEKPAKEKRSHGIGITVFSAVILVVIVVTFVGAPVVSTVNEQPAVNFGSYDGIPIEFAQGNLFAQQVEQLNRFYEQFNQGDSNLELQRQMVWRQAFDQTALQIGLKREAERVGIVVTDAQIDKQLVQHSAYQRDGKFSEELYRTTPSADRFRYRQETKTELLVQAYALDRTEGVMMAAATKNFVAGMAYPQKKFSFVSFTDADYPDNLVADYATKNKTLFRTIDLSRITVTSSEGDATKVREEAVKGEKAFADLAKTFSKDPLAQSGGSMSVRHYYELKADIVKVEDLDAIFSLAKGGISAVVKGDKTWTIYKVNAPATDADLASADTLAVVRSYIARNERGLLEDHLETMAKAFGDNAGADFAAAAKKAGKTVSQSQWVSLNFGNHDLFPSLTESSTEPVFQGLAANEDFFKKGFRLAKGQVSGPILASPAVLVVKVDEVKLAPEASDAPVTATAVAAGFLSERGSELKKQILSPPRFKDTFQAEFNQLFRAE